MHLTSHDSLRISIRFLRGCFRTRLWSKEMLRRPEGGQALHVAREQLQTFGQSVAPASDPTQAFIRSHIHLLLSLTQPFSDLTRTLFRSVITRIVIPCKSNDL